MTLAPALDLTTSLQGDFDGGTLLTTQHTHCCLILCLILRGGQIAFVSPNTRRNMLPWSIGGVTHLPVNAKLRKMQQNTDRLVQLIGATTPDVPSQAPMPQASKRLLNACGIAT